MVSMSSTLIIEISPPTVRGVPGTLSAGAIGLTGILSSGVAWGTFFFGVLLLAIIDLIIGCCGFADPTNVGVIKSIAGFGLLFGFVCYAGLSPLVWLVAAELPTVRLRNISNAWILLAISLFDLAVTYILPYIANVDAGNLGQRPV
ncbi:uncharacterized protein A1O5_07648 [Cladophialophora psammophila CBS 110553]|uniref:Uncharacterized protein n=1 Tax=Cladophialophora psammophila CBS 110553 TaxID=1182543 RepID=W9WN45_9EURO|nr:uncharacterized protein A1O5_07648 [Cladophialophora psammophila CBS 110553]EXJ69612.1 hypothetical protein A1O5_07648 [Cladophialophora psammophila CBS 110553]